MAGPYLSELEKKEGVSLPVLLNICHESQVCRQWSSHMDTADSRTRCGARHKVINGVGDRKLQEGYTSVLILVHVCFECAFVGKRSD